MDLLILHDFSNLNYSIRGNIWSKQVEHEGAAQDENEHLDFDLETSGSHGKVYSQVKQKQKCGPKQKTQTTQGLIIKCLVRKEIHRITINLKVPFDDQ